MSKQLDPSVDYWYAHNEKRSGLAFVVRVALGYRCYRPGYGYSKPTTKDNAIGQAIEYNLDC